MRSDDTPNLLLHPPVLNATPFAKFRSASTATTVPKLRSIASLPSLVAILLWVTDGSEADAEHNSTEHLLLRNVSIFRV